MILILNFESVKNKAKMAQLSKKSSKELLQLTKKLVPPLLPQFHKGQGGYHGT